MKNVLYLFVTMPVGGAEVLCLNIMKKLDRAKYNPIACCIGAKGEIGERAEGLGFRVIELGRMRGKKFDFGALKALANVIRKEKIDIVHTNMYHAGLYGRLAVLLAGSPRPKVVASHHSLFTRRKGHRLLVNRLLNRFTDRIVAVSQPVREDIIRYEKTPAEKVCVLENAVDIDRLNIPMSKKEAKERLGLNDEHFVLGMVGRLVQEKGHRYLLEALSILKNEKDNLRLIVAGAGRLENELKKEAARLGVSSMVHFLGMRHDIPEIYRAMDVFVMPSISEAAPLSLIDAMAAGLPCVITAVGGMVDIAEGGRCALVVPPSNAKALSEAVSAFYGSEELRNKYAAAASERARESFGADAMVRELEKVYDGLF